jgi:hypothetical protein
MGQVSILEDIQKAIDNLQHEISRSVAPTEVAIASQQKRLEKERERLSGLARTLLTLAKEIKHGLNDRNMENVQALLNVQLDKNRLSAATDELKLTERKIKEARKTEAQFIQKSKEKTNSILRELGNLESRLGRLKALEAKLAQLETEKLLLTAKIDGIVASTQAMHAPPNIIRSVINEAIHTRLSGYVKKHPNTVALKADLEHLRGENKRLIAENSVLREQLYRR